MISPAASRAGNLAALALGCLLGLLALEVGVRVLFPPPPEPPRPGRNEAGFRDSEHVLEKPEGLVRIAFIGDSYTWGQGVDRSRRFSELAAERIDAGLRDASVEMLNFGRPGASVSDVLRILQGAALHYDPDIIVYGFVLNDFSDRQTDLAFRDLRDRLLQEHRQRFPGLRALGTRLRTAAVLDRVLFDTTSGIEEAQLEFLRDLYRDGKRFRQRRRVLERLARTLSRESLLSVLVLMPYFLPEEAELELYRRAREVVAEAADRPRLEMVEVLPALGERPYHEWWVSPDDHHPNAAAHAVIADLVAERVLEITGRDWGRFLERRGDAPGSRAP